MVLVTTFNCGATGIFPPQIIQVLLLYRDQTVTNRPVVYNSMGAAATPALAY